MGKDLQYSQNTTEPKRNDAGKRKAKAKAMMHRGKQMLQGILKRFYVLLKE